MGKLSDKYNINNDSDISLVLDLLLDNYALVNILEFLVEVSNDRSELAKRKKDRELGEMWEQASHLIDSISANIEV